MNNNEFATITLEKYEGFRASEKELEETKKNNYFLANLFKYYINAMMHNTVENAHSIFNTYCKTNGIQVFLKVDSTQITFGSEDAKLKINL